MNKRNPIQHHTMLKENSMKVTKRLTTCILGIFGALVLVLGVSSFVVSQVPEVQAQTTYQTIPSHIDKNNSSKAKGNYLYVNVVMDGSGPIQRVEIPLNSSTSLTVNTCSLTVETAEISNCIYDNAGKKIIIDFKSSLNGGSDFIGNSGDVLNFTIGFKTYIQGTVFKSDMADGVYLTPSNFPGDSKVLSTQSASAAPSFKVAKTGLTTSPVNVAANTAAIFKYNISVSNTTGGTGPIPNPLVDTPKVPTGFTINSVTFANGTSAVSASQSGGSYSIAASALGSFAANETKNITVTVTATPNTTVEKDIATSPSKYQCSSLANGDGAWNEASMNGESDSAGTSNNSACIKLQAAASTTTTTTPVPPTTTVPATPTTTTSVPTTPQIPPSATYQTVDSYIDMSKYPAYAIYDQLYLDVVSNGEGEVKAITIDFPDNLDFTLKDVGLKVGYGDFNGFVDSWTRDPKTGLITVNFKPGLQTYEGQRFSFNFNFHQYFTNGTSTVKFPADFTDNSTIYLTAPVTAPGAAFQLEKRASTTTPVALEGAKQTTLAYEIEVTNVGDLGGKLPAGILDGLQLPNGMTIDGAAFSLNGSNIATTINGSNFEISPAALGEFAAGETKTIAVEVKATPDANLAKDVAANPKNYTCGDIAKKDGLWNKVSLVGERDTSLKAVTNNSACIRPFSTANTGPDLETVLDDISYLPDSLQNPPLQQRCGQNVAIIFDVSTSIGSTGLSNVKNAGNSIVDALAGTSANIGLFNFATNAPYVESAVQKTPLSMQDATNVGTLKDKIGSLSIPGTFEGGTNWEGGLQQVLNSGVHYDAVYFVTDGQPTTSMSRTDSPANGKGDLDYGLYTHTSEVAAAIDVANQLKLSGTHIEAITVNLPTKTEILLKESVYIYAQAGTDDNWTDGKFWVDNVNFSGLLSNAVDGGSSKIKQYPGSGQWSTSTDVTRDESLWADGRMSPADMMNHVVGPNQLDGSKYAVSPVGDFTKMAAQLRNLIVGPCLANLNITKTIVNPDGSTKRPGENWSFKAEALPNNIVLTYDSSGTPRSTAPNQTKQTDLFGKTTFGIGSQENQLVSVQELIPADSPYKLYPQKANKNAVCTMKKFNTSTQQIDTIAVPVTNSGNTGFDLNMIYESSLGAVRSVDCEVKNVEELAEISKQPTVGAPQIVNPDGTASLTYTIEVSNPAVGPISSGPVKEIFRLPASVEINGNVKLDFPEIVGSTVTGDIRTIPAADISLNKEVVIAQKIDLEQGVSQKITVTIPVKVKDMVGVNWYELGRCDGNGGAVSATGVPNSVAMAKDGDPSNNNACIPLTPPEMPLLKISKVAYDGDKDELNDVGLDGAEFGLYYDLNGKPDFQRGQVVSLGSGVPTRMNVQPGEYWLVETKSPAGYELLAQPVKLQFTGSADGWSAAVADGSGLVYVDTSKEKPATEIWIKVADVTSSKLPRTGGFGIGLPAGIAMLLIAAGFMYGRRRA
ncbi:von Willebrand factor type A domain protein [Corynebacterium kalinowskii]|uniref:von Willebrand factor type A domain protein n=1 Tax=Corynebacterium kalinowskii TaxID=2675216 RepID=A0A6B8VNP6_9CORY|nr:SpaA isopeptide-forming pilin-related protein [Corynebacterium kalinowskii]QGU03044.1 von Willebrand factor type A domain protein [Corynebacterium kalinowskii]